MELKRNNRSRCFDGWLEFYSFRSESCAGDMRFSIYLPPKAEKEKVPVLYWLSGLTCTEENFMMKAGAQKYAAEHGIILVAPDTSPRNTGIPNENAASDLGSGAGFYVNATQQPWARHYQMYDFVVKELPEIVESKFPILRDTRSISGHSMGGHGAMMVALRNPGRYRSVSVFAPISAPSQGPWGEKAFAAYLGDKTNWAQYDSNELVKRAEVKQPILLDQGSADSFLLKELNLDLFRRTCAEANYPLDVKVREGYDHGYYYISTFIGEHIAYHAKHLYS